MLRTALLPSLFVALLIAGSVVHASAQDVHAGAKAAKTIASKDGPKPEYWFSRDLSNVLTKVVTIKLH